MPITIYDLVIYRLGLTDNPPDQLNGRHFQEAKLPIMGGCEVCCAAIAAFNAYPSKSGFLRCRDDIGHDGWDSVEQADVDIFPEEQDPPLEDIKDLIIPDKD